MRNKKIIKEIYSEVLSKNIQITKPWNKEMYDHNEGVSELMKDELSKKLLEAYASDNEDTMRNIGEIINPIQYGHGYNYHDIFDDLMKNIPDLQNFWLNEEYPYGVEKGIVSKIKYEFIGY